jgi:hypothetical protein
MLVYLSEKKEMDNPQKLRDLARRCRVMAATAIKPSVINQLWLWAVELADAADHIERRRQRIPSHKTGSWKRELA